MASIISEMSKKQNKHADGEEGTNCCDVEEKVTYERITAFDLMGLKEELYRGICSYGFEKPSEVQQLTIKPLIMGHDVICQAQSGTGKTAAVCISVLQNLDLNIFECQAILLFSTRELVLAVHHLLTSLAVHMNVFICTCTSGGQTVVSPATSTGGAHVVCGTPGRVWDMIQRQALKLDHVKMLVVDPVDAVLNAGFLDHILDLHKALPSGVQYVFTLSSSLPILSNLDEKLMHNPLHILIRPDEFTCSGIQYYVAAEKEELKLEKLYDLFSAATVKQTVIYCNSRRKADWLVDQCKIQFPECATEVNMVCVDMELSQRNILIRDFEAGSMRILISSMSRRLTDIDCLTINYDLPFSPEDYLARVGRPIGLVKKGHTVINFVLPIETVYLRDIEKSCNIHIEELPCPWM